MSLHIHRPEVFFRKVHPASSGGRIVLERVIKKKKHHSQVTPNDAEKLFRLAYLIPGVNFSVASFTGMPLLTNFENTRCLYLRFNWDKDKKLKVDNAIRAKGCPHPTSVVTDGEKLTYFWMLEDIIKSSEFYKVYLLQYSLFQAFIEQKPCKESLEINSLIPLIGTINPLNNGFVSLIDNSGSVLPNQVAERLLLSRFSISDYEKLKNHSRAILELHALLNSRFMVWGLQNTCEDWLVFFGASLCYFCTKERLKNELQAIAVSLENKKWAQIKDRYELLINNVAATAEQGFINYSGQHFKLDRPDWFELVFGKLGITNEEIRKLGLSAIVPEKPLFVVGQMDTSNIQPLGECEFIPVERLMMKAVA